MTADTETAASAGISPESTSEHRIDRLDGRDRLALWSTVASLALAAVVIWREAETEPYHIDEFRQVRPYGEGLGELIDASFAQEQPPLDVLFGAGLQRVLGLGDVIQRGHSMLAGIVALGCLAVLLWRHRVRLGIPVAVVTLALTPVFISFTAYARPYALPLALMVGFLLAVDVWLERAGPWSAAAIVVLAALLPASRVFEPPALLVITAVTLLIVGRRHETWGRRIWLPIGAAAGSLLLVELPIYLRLSERLTAYQGDASASFADQWTRIIDDSIPRLAGVFVNGWLALVLVVVAIAWPLTRRRLLAMWWFWPLVLTPAAFAVAFHLRTQPDQPFFERYGYFWLPAFAVVVGLLAEGAVDLVRSGPADGRTRILAGAAVVVLAVFGVQLVVATADDLRATDRADLRSLGQGVERQLPTDTAVVFDPTGNPLGAFDTRFPPLARYTVPERPVFMAEAFVWFPVFADGIGSYAISTNGEVVDVAGWTPNAVGEAMTLYVDDGDRIGPLDLGADLVDFGAAHRGWEGSMLTLAGAMLLIHNGAIDDGCAAIRSLPLDDAGVESTVRTALRRAGDADFVERCATTS